jgi:N6-adenosine-specific RNA methylase IME4
MYDVIYADPCWKHNVLEHAAPDHELGRAFSGIASNSTYSVMTLDEIKALQPQRKANRDAALFLWVLSGYLEEAFEVIRAWDFKHRTVAFCWVKITETGALRTNLSPITLPGMELCLYATRGKATNVVKMWSKCRQVIEEPFDYDDVASFGSVYEKVTRHSRKPDVFRENIEKMTPDKLRLEMFAREKFRDWHVWGNEVQSDVEF